MHRKHFLQQSAIITSGILLRPSLSFAGTPPDAAELSRRWHRMVAAARAVIDLLPPDESGKCVLYRDGRLFSHEGEALSEALAAGAVSFHAGSIRGALPRLLESR